MEPLPRSVVCTAAQTSSTHSEGFGVFYLTEVISQHIPGLQLCSRAPHGESKWWSWIGQTGLTDWGGFGVEAPVRLSMLQFLSTSASPGAFSGAQTWGRACSSGAENERTGTAAREEEKLCKDQSFECTVPALGMLLCCGFCLVPPVGAPEWPPRHWQGSGGAGALPAQPLPPQLCPRGISERGRWPGRTMVALRNRCG